MKRIPLDRSINASLSILAALGVLALLHYAASVVITILTSTLVALALEPLVQLLRKRARLSRRVASLVTVCLAVALLYGAISLAYGSAVQLFTDLPHIVDQVRSAPLVQSMTGKLAALAEKLQEAGRRISPVAGPGGAHGVVVREGTSLRESIFRGLGSISGVIFSLSFIPFLVYFILA